MCIDDFNALIQDKTFIDQSVENLRRTLGPLSGSTRQGLRFVLASLYVDEASARRLADAAHLYCGEVAFAANPVTWWDQGLAHAEARGNIEDVIEMALNDFGESRALQEAVRQYREGEKQRR